MSELDKLDEAITNLSKNVIEFPIGAVCLDDFKPTDAKIKNLRESLKRLNAKLLMLKSKHETQLTEDVSDKIDKDTLEMLQDATANAILNSKAIELCLHSHAIHALMSEVDDQETREKLCAYAYRLFTLNDSILSLQESIEKASQRQLKLKMQCQKSLSEYHDFLKEQEQLWNKRLHETDPEIAETKERMERTLRRINITKKLITNFIAASGHLLRKNPFLLEMLEKHRESINLETIMEMTQTPAEESAL